MYTQFISSSGFQEGFAEVCAGSHDGTVPAAPIQFLGLLCMFDMVRTPMSLTIANRVGLK